MCPVASKKTAETRPKYDGGIEGVRTELIVTSWLTAIGFRPRCSNPGAGEAVTRAYFYCHADLRNRKVRVKNVPGLILTEHLLSLSEAGKGCGEI